MIRAAFRIKGQPVFRYLKFLKSVEHKSLAELTQLQNERLRQLLKHAYENVPYYNKVLSQTRVVENQRVNLDKFQQIPVLTKAVMRREGQNLYSTDYQKRRWYRNSSGGSTGEPAEFLQDKNYQAWAFASRFLYNWWAGKDVGEPELKLWGSERDVLDKAEKLSTRLRRWGFNTVILNTFLMTEQTMSGYARCWNKLKPKLVGAYTSSMLQFAEFIERSAQKVFTPSAIICGAETLTEDVRQTIKRVFRCAVLNQYGARETGAIASECLKAEGQHVFSLNHKVEILDDNLAPCKPGQTGHIYVTTLNNYTMPLIRYAIGDMAVVAENEQCSCGRGWPLIKQVVGRHVEVFKTREGRIVPGEFFIHFVGVVFNKNYIKKFQVVQKDYDHVIVKLVVIDEPKFVEFKNELTDSIKRVMGRDCRVEFDYVDDIQSTRSGKYLYTISEVS
jgi:phenylacetate-CoA ligase